MYAEELKFVLSADPNYNYVCKIEKKNFLSKLYHTENLKT